MGFLGDLFGGGQQTNTSYQRDSLPNWQQYLYPYLNQFASQYGSGMAPGYGGQLSAGQTPAELQSLGTMGSVLGQLFNYGNGGGGASGQGLFDPSLSTMQGMLSPQFANPANNPYFQQQMTDTLGGIRGQFGQAGLDYSTPLANAEVGGAAGVLAPWMQQNQGLQAGLAQSGLGTAMGALGQGNQYGLQQQQSQQSGLTNAYQEWLRQQQTGMGGLQTLFGTGLTMAGQPLQVQQNQSSGGLGSILGSLLPGLLGL